EAGTYDGSTTTRLSTETKTQQNNMSWRTYIYYTFADNPTWVEGVDWDTDSDEELGIFVANEDWTRYDADNAPFITIPYGTHTLSAVTVSEYMNGKEKFVSSTIATTEYTITEANLAIVFTPKPGHYVNSQNVTLNASNPVGTVHIYYTLGDEARDFTYYRDNVNSSEILVGDDWIEYTTGTPILMESGITRIRVAAFDQRGDEVTGHLATRDEVFEIGVQPVTFSPIGSEDSNNPANYYSGEQTLQMYSVSPKARVYYAIAEASGTVPPAAPATPDLNSLRYSDDVTINLEAGKSYAVTAVAYVGRTPSAPRTVYYTIYNADNNIQDIATMNNMRTNVTGTLSNPVQVVYMSTHQHDGETPEFAYVRDNSGYGLIYFGNGLSKYKGLKIFKRGDWIAGDVIKSKTAVWSEGFINEFGSRDGDVDKDLWPTDKIGHTPILPETMTNARIMEGWDADAYASSTATGSAKYAAGVKENNVWGHYVHLRKNTIDVKTTVSGKYQGIITDESGVSVTYYDGFYNFSNYGTGENATPNYDKKYFDDIKNNGGTVDVYGVVGFYGPLVDNSTYKNNPMEIFPIAFATIYKPMYNINPEEGQIYREPQTISLTCQSVGAQIWYKTSEMEGFELYTNPFTVEHSTTIETYSTLVNEEFNDELESVVNTLVLNIGEVAQPVISPNSVVKAVGDDAVNCTITCDTEGAVIYYTTDGSDPSDENGTREIYTEPLSFSTTTTVRAIAEDGGYYSTEAESRTYTFVYSNGIVFDLVTDESQLDESSVYIIVNQESHMAMSNEQKENNRDATGVMFVDETTKAQVYGNADVALFTLRKYGNNFQFYTTNGLTDAADGYLCVGNGNKLLTEATQDNEANCDATIEITSDNKAHIHFLYNSEVDRYLRFWKRDNLFNCYTTESNGDVYLYRVMATPLATIEEFGTTVEGKNQYTIADELVCVWQSKNHLWCKDQGNVSIWRTAPLEGQEDFMMSHSTYGAKRSNKTWDQSNWVRIDFDNTTSGGQAVQNCVGHLLDAATISALFIDKNNYTMSLPGNGSQELTKVKEVASKEATAEQLELNVYGPANFLEENLRLNDNQGARGSDGEYYYLVNPKVQEVCIITWAVWDGNQFVIPAYDAEGTNNQCDFDGAISIGTWAYNSEGNQSANLEDGEAYTFTAVVESVGNGYGPARISGKGGQTNVTVSPLNFDPTNQEQIVTDVQAVKTGREVAGVTYYNVAGQMSKTPFEGSVNIVVTKYTDGTKKTAKVVF
ncbi:MAG: chitobiase/beta-hexosaminidase C-terminal domain-containing protein, partial [Muribaculaceae bacterium]|nr:chitobiase/beta-hexosaminidase C-terminal domain-containing protein [Muribaculaceae bacterium]